MHFMLVALCAEFVHVMLVALCAEFVYVMLVALCAEFVHVMLVALCAGFVHVMHKPYVSHVFACIPYMYPHIPYRYHLQLAGFGEP